MAELVAELRCDVFERFAPVVAFNVVGTVDFIGDYYHGTATSFVLRTWRRVGAAYEIVNDLRAPVDDHAPRRVLFC